MNNTVVRLHGRRSTAALIAAGTASSLAMSSPAGASHIVDVRALLLNGQPLAGGDGPKAVNVSGAGDIVTLGLFSRVTGTNGANDELVKTAHGNLLSSGSLLGDLAGGVVAPFNGSAFQNGSNVDLDTDTDLDVGAPLGSAGTAALGYILARANSAQLPTPIDANSGEIQIGQFTFTVGAPSGTETLVNWVRRSTATGGNQLTGSTWFEDVSPSKNPTNALYGSGTPVFIGVIPEPSAAALAGVAALGLLARRKRGGAS